MRELADVTWSTGLQGKRAVGNPDAFAADQSLAWGVENSALNCFSASALATALIFF